MSGYTPIGIIEYNNPISASLLLYSYSASAVALRNVFNQAFSGTIKLKVLYAR